MTKENKKDVTIPCFGNINGCLVAHCDVAGYCEKETKYRKIIGGLK